MVLELHTPHRANWAALRDEVRILLAHVLSFANIGVYRNDHHHMFAVSRVTGGMLWANLYLLFWLSLIPFTTCSSR